MFQKYSTRGQDFASRMVAFNILWLVLPKEWASPSFAQEDLFVTISSEAQHGMWNSSYFVLSIDNQQKFSCSLNNTCFPDIWLLLME